MGSKIDRRIAEERIAKVGRDAAWLDEKYHWKTKNPYNFRTRANANRIWQRAYDERFGV